MKGLILPIIQILFSVAAIFSFIVLAIGGEPVLRWIPALVMAILLGASGIICIIADRRDNKLKSSSEQ